MTDMNQYPCQLQQHTGCEGRQHQPLHQAGSSKLPR